MQPAGVSTSKHLTRCLHCLGPIEIVKDALLFRGKRFCSAHCNNRYMGRIDYLRQKKNDGTGRLSIIYDQHLMRGDRGWRGWINFGDYGLSLETYLRGLQFGVGFDLKNSDADNLFTVHFKVPGISIYFSVDVPWKLKRQICPDGNEGRHIGIDFINDSICFNFWHNGEYNVPWYRHFYVCPKDIILGSAKCTTEIIDQGKCEVPMIEGVYPATWKFEKRTWKRTRWPFPLTRLSTDISIDHPGGIPFPGKGESSWDCGDTGLCATGVNGHDVAKAVKHVQDAVNEYRQKRGMPSKDTLIAAGMMSISQD